MSRRDVGAGVPAGLLGCRVAGCRLQDDLNIGRELPKNILVLVLGLTFSAVAPLLPLAAAAFFATYGLLYRHHIL